MATGQPIAKPAIYADPDVVRDLLKKLNTRVVLHWTPKGKRYFKLDYGMLRVELDPSQLVKGKHCHTCTAS